MLDGTVIGRNMQRHRYQEFIRFLNAVDAEVPAGKAVHVVLDNYAAHKHPKVRAWLDRHQRFISTSRRPRARRSTRSRASSPSCRSGAINRYLAEHNRQPKPFVWTADPDDIIAAVKRGHQVLDSIH